MQAYYELLEEARLAFVDEHGYGAVSSTSRCCIPKNCSMTLRERIEQAASKVENEDPVYANTTDLLTGQFGVA